MISFRRGKTKVRVPTEARNPTPRDNNPLYAKGVHMLDGLTYDEMHAFLEENPTIVPLFEIDVLSAVEPYIPTRSNPEELYKRDATSLNELQHAREALERELAISQRVKAYALEDINISSEETSRTAKIAKDLAHNDRSALITLLTEY